MKKPRHSSYPMPIEEADELARELSEFGYRETDDPDEADRRRFYKVERWDSAELHVEALLYACNDLSKARAIFAAWRAGRAGAIRCARISACLIVGRLIAPSARS
jgi:hypothetical protein